MHAGTAIAESIAVQDSLLRSVCPVIKERLRLMLGCLRATPVEVVVMRSVLGLPLASSANLEIIAIQNSLLRSVWPVIKGRLRLMLECLRATRVELAIMLTVLGLPLASSANLESLHQE